MRLPSSDTVSFWNGVMVLALVALAGIAIYDNVVPSADGDVATAPIRKEFKEAEADLLLARAEVNTLERQVAAQAWSGSLDTLSPTVIGEVNVLASAAGVRIKAFRPQRAVEGDDLQMLSFLISVEGAFPNVVAMVEGLEKQENRLAVKQVRLGAADDETGFVDATIGIVAYALVEEIVIAGG